MKRSGHGERLRSWSPRDINLHWLNQEVVTKIQEIFSQKVPFLRPRYKWGGLRALT
jgi:hypothetical protein